MCLWTYVYAVWRWREKLIKRRHQSNRCVSPGCGCARVKGKREDVLLLPICTTLWSLSSHRPSHPIYKPLNLNPFPLSHKLHMKLAVWFSFPTTNNKNPMIPSWSLVSIYNYSFNPDQIFTKNFEILELEICSKIFTWDMIFLQVNSSLPTSLKKYVLSH